MRELQAPKAFPQLREARAWARASPGGLVLARTASMARRKGWSDAKAQRERRERQVPLAFRAESTVVPASRFCEARVRTDWKALRKSLSAGQASR